MNYKITLNTNFSSFKAIKDGFGVDYSRLSIEPDATKTITFKFDPAANNPNRVCTNYIGRYHKKSDFLQHALINFYRKL